MSRAGRGRARILAWSAGFAKGRPRHPGRRFRRQPPTRPAGWPRSSLWPARTPNRSPAARPPAAAAGARAQVAGALVGAPL